MVSIGVNKGSELEDKITAVDTELQSLNQQLDFVHQQITESERKLKQEQEYLQAYHKVKELGFNESVLAKLHNLCQQYGGAKEVIKAVETETGYTEIAGKLNAAKAEHQTNAGYYYSREVVIWQSKKRSAPIVLGEVGTLGQARTTTHMTHTLHICIHIANPA